MVNNNEANQWVKTEEKHPLNSYIQSTR